MTLPPIDPPTIWVNPDAPAGEARALYFGNAKECPEGTTRGNIASYRAWYLRQVENHKERQKTIQANLEAGRAIDAEHRAVTEAKLEAGIPLALDPTWKVFEDTPSFERRESPYTRGARLTHWSPPPPDDTPTRERRRPMGNEQYEVVIASNRDDPELQTLMLQIYRQAPDPGLMSEVSVLDVPALATLGGVAAYLKEHHFDGRPARFQVRVMIDGEQEGVPYLVQLPRDPLREAEVQAELEASVARARQRHNLPPLPAPGVSFAGAPPAAPPAPPGYLSVEQVQELCRAAAIEATRAALAQIAPPAAPQAAPPAPPPPAFVTREEADARIKAIIAETIASLQPAKPIDPAKQMEQGVTALANSIEATQRAQEKLTAALGIKTPEPTPEKAPDKAPLFYEVNGIQMTESFVKSSPNGSMLAANLPIVQGVAQTLTDGLSKGIKDAILAGAEVRKAEAAALLQEAQAKRQINDEAEREIALQERRQRVGGGSTSSSSTSSSSPPRRQVEVIDAEPAADPPAAAAPPAASIERVPPGGWAPPKPRRTSNAAE